MPRFSFNSLQLGTAFVILSTLALIALNNLQFKNQDSLQDLYESVAAQETPQAPGELKIEIPVVQNTTPTTPGNTIAPNNSSNNTSNSTSSNLPPQEEPEKPRIVTEEIVDGTDTTLPVVEDTGFNLKNNVNTTKPVYDPTFAQENSLGLSQSETVRSGGEILILVIISGLIAGGGYYFYKTRGDRKAKFKLNEAKIKTKKGS